ncbi:hypothetical protein J4G37_31650 [Microvirga sp. 3-52]|nr:hypothetical protein [Microvirga sp. 3-52]
MNLFIVLLMSGLVLGYFLRVVGIALVIVGLMITVGLIQWSYESRLSTVVGSVVLSTVAIQAGYFMTIVAMVAIKWIQSKMGPVRRKDVVASGTSSKQLPNGGPPLDILGSSNDDHLKK